MLDQSEANPPSFRGRIAQAQLRELYDLWLAHSSDTAVMPRSALDPVAMPSLLKNLILADVGAGGRDISYRLVGTEIVEAHGFDYTGWNIERLTSGSTLAFTQRLYGMVVSRAVPVYSEGHFRWRDKEFHWVKRLHLPLSRDADGRVDMVLAGQYFETEYGEEELLLPARPEQLAADRRGLIASR
ncbi:MAG: PAS domain-containing protein [Kiloniellaceae bacterium]